MFGNVKEILPAHQNHPREFEEFRFVYPVLSRRSGGISIGLNVNPDKKCNFDCLYCQVDRTVEPSVKTFDLAVAEKELRAMVALVESGELARHPQFADVPKGLLRLRDVALSGDGEPTTLPEFAKTVEMIFRVKPARAKAVLITDAAGLDRAEVKRGLDLMDAHGGEVWAKLDAGTKEYFRLINQTQVPLERILRNITECAKARPIVVQSMFVKVQGQSPSADEIGAYSERLREIVAAGGKIRLIQICTVARRAMTMVNGLPAWQFVAALGDAELDAIATCVRHRTGLETKSYHGSRPTCGISQAAKTSLTVTGA
jgi:wyosine [tRNA(Phe)-imidazoG37] synthetase (radical SAM superfamily)